MFRITRSDERSRTTLVVDGQLCGDGISAVESCCEQEIATGKPLQVLLRDMTNIDEAGKALLRRLAGKGVCLVACGVYTSYLVEKITASKHVAH